MTSLCGSKLRSAQANQPPDCLRLGPSWTRAWRALLGGSSRLAGPAEHSLEPRSETAPTILDLQIGQHRGGVRRDTSVLYYRIRGSVDYSANGEHGAVV